MCSMAGFDAQILPFWADRSLHNLAELLCMRCARGARNLEVDIFAFPTPVQRFAASISLSFTVSVWKLHWPCP